MFLLLDITVPRGIPESQVLLGIRLFIVMGSGCTRQRVQRGACGTRATRADSTTLCYHIARPGLTYFGTAGALDRGPPNIIEI